ncbi:hypothetical protein PVAP13_9KG062614 [Panicum virgatum]|uniref:Uncharacterized protein n=1 Tax=Panicum virgatum TaxID=38727 RepID=A0A8T0NJC1_PANVG|nr:hypothetical protein PVAP13_9KG062614 [Panicum virgatum]
MAASALCARAASAPPQRPLGAARSCSACSRRLSSPAVLSAASACLASAARAPLRLATPPCRAAAPRAPLRRAPPPRLALLRCGSLARQTPPSSWPVRSPYHRFPIILIFLFYR